MFCHAARGQRNRTLRIGRDKCLWPLCAPPLAIIIRNLSLTMEFVWDNTMHLNAGNMVMADGSAHQFSQVALTNAMASSGDPRNCALKPD